MTTENKTKQTELSVSDFLNTVEDEKKRKDSFAISDIMKEVSGFEPKMWGPAIVGFGTYHYKYESGREGDSCIVGFSPRKANLTLYLMGKVFEDESLMKTLGKYKTSKGCLYINKLEDVNTDTLKVLIKKSIAYNREAYAG